MSFRKICVFLLLGLVSFASFATIPTVRTSTLRFGQPVSTQSAPSVPNRAAINKLTPGRGQIGVTNSKIPSTNNQNNPTIEAVYDEINKMRALMNEQLNAHRQELDILRAEIAEKNEVIANLESSLADYEEIKQSVKNIPDTISQEITNRGLASADIINTQIETAKQDAINGATAEIRMMGYATNDEVRRSLESAKNEVAENIIQAKDDAIAAAKQHVDNSNFATKTDLGNLELGTDEETVKNIIVAQLTENKVVTEETLEDVQQQVANITDAIQSESVARAQALDALDTKYETAVNTVEATFAQYAKKQDVENLDLGLNADEVNELLAKRDEENESYQTATDNAIAEIRDSMLAYDNKLVETNTRFNNYATNEAVEVLNVKVDENAVAIENESVARGNAFNALDTKYELAVDTVDAKFAQYATKDEVNNLELGTDEEAVKNIILAQLEENKIVTESELDTLSAEIDLVRANTQENTEKFELYATKGALGEVDAKFAGYVTSAVFGDALAEAKNSTLESVADLYAPKADYALATDLNVYAKNDDVESRFSGLDNKYAPKANYALASDVTLEIAEVDGKFKNYATNDDVELRFNGLDDKYAAKAPYALASDVTVAVAEVDGKFKNYATTDALSAVDGKFAGYTSTEDMNLRFNGLDDKYAAKAPYALASDVTLEIAEAKDSTLESVAGMGFAKTIDVNNRFANIGDSIADELVLNTDFTGQIVGMLDENLKTLPGVVEGLRVELDNVPTLINEAKIGAIADAKEQTLTAVNGLGFAKANDLNKYVPVDGFELRVTGLPTVAGLIDDVNEFPQTLITVKDEAINDAKEQTLTAVDGLGFAKTIDVNDRFANIGDTIADELVLNTDFTGQIVGMLDENLKTLPGVVEGLRVELDNVPTLISEAKIGAITDAKEQTLTAVNGLGFAKSTELKNYATTDALNAVDGKFAGYTSTEDMNLRFNGLDDKYAAKAPYALASDVTVAVAKVDSKFKNYATTDALNAVDGKFAGYTSTEDMNLRFNGLDDKYAAKAPYALASDVTLEIAEAKDSTLESVAGMGFAKANDLNKYVPVDGFELRVTGLPTVAGLIDDVNEFPQTLITVKDEAINDAKEQTLTAVNGLGFAKSTDLQAVDGKLAGYVSKDGLGEAVGGLKVITDLQSDFAGVPTLISEAKIGAIADAKEQTLTAVNGLGFAKANDLNKYVPVDGFELRVTGLPTVAGLIDDVNEFPQTLITVKDEAINEAKEQTLTAVNGLGFAKTIDVNNRFANIGDSIADELVLNTDFTGQIVGMLDENLKTLPGVVEGLRVELDNVPTLISEAKIGAIADAKEQTLTAVNGLGFAKSTELKNYATTDALNAVDGKFAGYTSTEDMNLRFNGLDDKYAAKAPYALASDVTLEIAEAKDSTLESVAGMGFAKANDLNKYVPVDGFELRVTGLPTVAGLIDDVNEFPQTLNTVKDEAINEAKEQTLTAVNGLGFATGDDLLALDNKYAPKANYALASDVTLEIAEAKDSTLESVTGMGFAKANDLNKYVPVDGFELRVTGLPTVAGLIDDVNEFPQTLITVKDEAINEAKEQTLTAVNGLGFAKANDLDKYVPVDGFELRVTGLPTVAGLIDDVNEFPQTLITVKDEAINEAKEQTLTAVNGLGFAKSTELKNYATTDALSAVDGKFAGYTSTEDMNLRFNGLDDKYAAKAPYALASDVTLEIAEAKDSTLESVTGMGFAKANDLNKYVPVDGFELRVTGLPTVAGLIDDVNEFPQTLITVKDEAINEAKEQTLTAVNGLGFAKANDLNKYVPVDGFELRVTGLPTVAGLIDDVNEFPQTLITVKDEAINEAKEQTLTAVNGLGFATGDDLLALDSKYAPKANYALTSDVTLEIAEAKDSTLESVAGMGFAKANDLNKYVPVDGFELRVTGLPTVAGLIDDVNEFPQTLITVKDEAINEAKEQTLTAVNGFGFATGDDLLALDNKYAPKANYALASDVTVAVAEVDGKFKNYATNDDVELRFNGLDDKYAAKAPYALASDVTLEIAEAKDSTLESVAGMGFAKANDLNKYVPVDGFELRVTGLPTVAGLIDDVNEFPQTLITVKDEAINEAKEQTLTAVNGFGFAKSTELKNYATTDALNAVDGKFAGYTSTEDMNLRFNGLDDKYAAKAPYALASDVTLEIAEAKDSTLESVAGMGFAKANDLNKYVPVDGFELRVTGLPTVAGLIDDVNEFPQTLITVKDEAINEAKEQTLTAVNGLGFAKSTELKNYATTDALSAVDGKFAGYTSTEDMNLRFNGLDDKYAAKAPYALASDVTLEIAEAKDSTLESVAGMGFAKANDLNKYVPVDGFELRVTGLPTVAGLIDDVNEFPQTLITVKDEAINDAKEQTLTAVNGLGFAKSTELKNYATNTALTAVDGKFAGYVSKDGLGEAVGGLKVITDLQSDFADVPTLISEAKIGAIADAKEQTLTAVDGLGFAKSTELKNYATNTALNAVDGKFAGYVLKDGLGEAVDGLGFAKSTELKNYATNTALNTVDGKFASYVSKDGLGEAVNGLGFAKTIDVNDRFANIGDTIADELVLNTDFTGQIVGMLDENLKTLPGVVEGLRVELDNVPTLISEAKIGAIADAKEQTLTAVNGLGFAKSTELKNYATNTALNAVDGKFAGYVLKDGLGEAVGGLKVITDLQSDFADVPTLISEAKIGAIADAKEQTLTAVNGLGFAKSTDLQAVDGKFADYVPKTGLGEAVGGLKVITDLQSDFAGVPTLISEAKIGAIADAKEQTLTAVNGLGFAKSTELKNYATNTALNAVDGKFAGYVLKDGLGEAVGGLKVITDLQSDFADVPTLISEAKIGAIADAKEQTLTAVNGLGFAKSTELKNYATNTALTALDGKFADYVPKTGLGEAVSGLKVITDLQSDFADVPTLISEAKIGAIADAKEQTLTAVNGLGFAKSTELKNYATNTALNAVDGKFAGYVSKDGLGEAVGGLKVITDLQSDFAGVPTLISEAKIGAIADAKEQTLTAVNGLGFAKSTELKNYATNTALNAVDGKFASYVSKGGLGEAVGGLKVITDLQSDFAGVPTLISEAKIGAIADAKEQTLTAVNGLGFAKALEVNNRFATMDVAMEELPDSIKNATLDAVDDRGFAVAVEVNNRLSDIDAAMEELPDSIKNATLDAVDDRGFAVAVEVNNRLSDIDAAMEELPDSIKNATLAEVDGKGFLTASGLGNATVIKNLQNDVSDVANNISAEVTARENAISGLSSVYAPKGNYLTASNAYSVLNNTWGANQIEGLIGKSSMFSSLPAAVQTNRTNIANEATARATAISGLRGDMSTLNTGLSNLGSNLNTLGEQVETNSTNISTNASAINSSRSTITAMNSRLVSTINRVNEFTSCDGPQQCYANDLPTGGTITILPGASIGPGGDFTWTPTNP